MTMRANMIYIYTLEVYRSLHEHFTVSRGVARMLGAHVQRHVMGPLVRNHLSNLFAARTGKTIANYKLTHW